MKNIVGNLTEGNIKRNIWALAVPTMGANILQTVFNIVDMFWVGKLGPDAIAAVAISGSLLMVIITLLIGISAGTLAMVSRFIGAKEEENANTVAGQSIILAVIGSLLIGIIGYFITPWLLRLIGAKVQVLSLAEGYMRISFLGIITIFLLFLVNPILRGAGDSLTPMLIVSGSAIINIIIDPLLIFGIGFPKLGVNGAALGTVIARGIGAVVGLWIIFKGYSHIKVKSLEVNFNIIWRIIKIGIPSTLEMGFRSIVGIVLMVIVAKYGTFALAAYGVGLRIFMIVLMPGFGLASASAIMVGQNLGAKKPDRAQTSALTAAGFYVLIMALTGIVFFVFAKPIINIFNPNLEIVKFGMNYLRVTAPGFLFIALGIVLGRSLNGAGDTISPMVITLITLGGLQVPLALFLPGYLQIGVVGVWWSILIATVIHGLAITGWFQLGRWKTKEI